MSHGRVDGRCFEVRRGIGFACIAALSLAVRPAGASCAPPSQELLWSHPADGDVGIPTDSDLFVTGELQVNPSIDGEALARTSPGVYDLGELAPNTTYEIHWVGELGDLAADLAVVSFTTGDGPSEQAVPEPSPDVSVTRNPAPGSCPLVLPQGCFDTGPPTRVRFDPGMTPVVWIVDRLECDGSVSQMLWPGACGAPVIERDDRIACVGLRASDGVYVSESTGVVCSAPQLPPNVTLPRLSSCVGAWPPNEMLTLTARDGVTLSTLEMDPEASLPAQPSETAAAPSPAAQGCSFEGPVRSPGSWLAGLLALVLVRRARRTAMI